MQNQANVNGENMNMFRFIKAFSLGGILAVSNVAIGQIAPRISSGDFAKRAEFRSLTISPRGDKFAAISEIDGRDRLVILDMAKKKKAVVSAFDKFDVASFAWVNNSRLMLSYGETKKVLTENNIRSAAAVDSDGENVRDLYRVNGEPVGIRFLRRIDDESGDAIVEMNLRRREAFDVYRLNTKTGRADLLTETAPEETGAWLVDKDLVPRVAIAGDPKTNQEIVWYREGAGAPWQVIERHDGDDPAVEKIVPVAFSADEKNLLVLSNKGRDKTGLFEYDPRTKSLGKLLIEDTLVDIERDDLAISGTTGHVQYVRIDAEKPRIVWLNKSSDTEAVQAMVDGTLKGRTNQLTWSAAMPNRVLITSTSDRQVGQYYLLDREKRALEELPSVAPWLKEASLAPVRYEAYTARDGRNIPAWLTLPTGLEPKNLPLILHVHGGPVARSYGWQYSGYGQFLANRGYAVMEPEPRASLGFGRAHVHAGYKKWGQEMQDDLTDSVKHLVAKGIVDPKRVCIFGGSYGGYAVLMGLAKDPDLYACGYATVAVSDLVLLQTDGWSDTNRGRYDASGYYKKVIGDLSADKAMLEANSPYRFAEKIKAPLRLVMGSDDQRVPIAHADKMLSSLKRFGKAVDYHVYAGEGHGFNKKENRIEEFNAMEKFFGMHLKK